MTYGMQNAYIIDCSQLLVPAHNLYCKLLFLADQICPEKWQNSIDNMKWIEAWYVACVFQQRPYWEVFVRCGRTELEFKTIHMTFKNFVYQQQLQVTKFY